MKTPVETYPVGRSPLRAAACEPACSAARSGVQGLTRSVYANV